MRSLLSRFRRSGPLVIVLTLLAATLAGVWAPNPTSPAKAQDVRPHAGRVIVVMRPPAGSARAASVTSIASTIGIITGHVFDTVFNGFSATISQDQATALALNPNVAAIYPDLPVHEAAQVTPTGINTSGPIRIRSRTSAAADRSTPASLCSTFASIPTRTSIFRTALIARTARRSTPPARRITPRTSPARLARSTTPPRSSAWLPAFASGRCACSMTPATVSLAISSAGSTGWSRIRRRSGFRSSISVWPAARAETFRTATRRRCTSPSRRVQRRRHHRRRGRQ